MSYRIAVPATNRLSRVMAAGALVAGTLLAGLSATPATSAQTAPAPSDPSSTAAQIAQVIHDVSYMTTGERARQGDFPFAPYTAIYDDAVAAKATARAALLASSGLITTGIAPVNTISTGWEHQREIVARGTVGPHTAQPYENQLFGLNAGPNGTPDARYELMAGPKTRTAVGVAPVANTGEFVVVVVNGYASEPTVGGPVAPVPTAPVPTDGQSSGLGSLEMVRAS